MRISALLLCLAAGLSAQSTDPAAYTNPALPAEKRAADLVSRMTLDEKVLQMQNSAPALPRLNIPAYDWWNEALHGVARAGQATVFPQAIGMAATFDTSLMHQIADTISTEARAKYNEALRTNNHARYFGLTFWSPNINIFRDPRWGRGQETYGEDPFLTGRLAVAFIKGMQGDDPHYFKVIATAKHYAVHSGPETSRHQFDVKPSTRDLNETYLPAFRAAIMEGKADSVMCAYNAVDGVPACANTDLLQKRLKEDWGFQGYVVSDCGAISDIYTERYPSHKYKTTAGEASAVAVKAGTDLTCGNEYRSLVGAVKDGLITEKEIDQSLERLFVARFKLGMFDPPERVPFSSIPYSEADSAAHRKVALQAARESVVLLKNDNEILPLKAGVKKIAVIGPSADDPVALLGNYNGFSQHYVTPLEGIERQYAGKAEIHFALGATYTPQSAALLPASALTPPAGSGHGLLAEYFDNPEFQGQPKVARVEDRPNLQVGVVDAALAAAFPLRSGYSVRWSGTLRPPVSGDYTITIGGGFGRPSTHLFLNDNELAAPAPIAGAGRGAPAPIHAQLEAGTDYKLRVEFRPQGPAGSVQISWIPPAEPLLEEALAAVKASDVTVAFVGLNPNLEGEEMRVSIPGFSGGDRTNLELPELQEKLIEGAMATGKPVVVVLTSGSALSANYAASHAAALLELWYGGEESGTAIAETLAGTNNPAGRLPVTFYKSVEQLPAFDDYSMNRRTYKYFKGDALYGFGYGLSYSKFQYSGLRAQRNAKGGQVSVRVKNTSAREGDEVVQLYVEGDGGAESVIRKLAGFQRIHLRAGESRDVQFAVDPAVLTAAKVKVSVGGGQPVGAIPHADGVM
ncbi:MAG TPA: glycoside hydrolase family 3 C-terminal domain-containing protein [Candidatus Sulfopaludibacter sp.]|jgi:beta-glucosidase|nr:glycoside hydrolase family 3 C-terminal domain-containing protein [Candidatus Sulfopaludibacter sp.]